MLAISQARLRVGVRLAFWCAEEIIFAALVVGVVSVTANAIAANDFAISVFKGQSLNQVLENDFS